jgi:hypothetical protein
LTPKNPPAAPLGVGDPFAGASDIVVSPDGDSAYVSIFEALISQNGSIAQFSIGPAGALTPKAPATVPADGHPTLLAVTTDGRNLDATDQPDGKVLEYRASRDGTLSPNAAAVTAGRYPFGIVVSARCPRRLFFARCRDTVLCRKLGQQRCLAVLGRSRRGAEPALAGGRGGRQQSAPNRG